MENSSGVPAGSEMEGRGSLLAKLNEALQSPSLAEQITLWRTENSTLYDVVSCFWKTEKEAFSRFWSDPSATDVRAALIETALDDLPHGFMEGMAAVCCPELAASNLSSLLLDERKVPALFDVVVEKREKEALEEQLREIATSETAVFQGLQSPEYVRDLLVVARSCGLLVFTQAIALVYSNIASGAE